MLHGADSPEGARWAGEMGRWIASTAGLSARAFRAYNAVAKYAHGSGDVAVPRRVLRRAMGSAASEARAVDALLGTGMLTPVLSQRGVHRTGRRKIWLPPLRTSAVSEVRARRMALATADLRCALSATAWRVAHVALALTRDDGVVELTAPWLAEALRVTVRAARAGLARLVKAGVLVVAGERRWRWAKPEPEQLNLFASPSRSGGTIWDTYRTMRSKKPVPASARGLKPRTRGIEPVAAVLARYRIGQASHPQRRVPMVRARCRPVEHTEVERALAALRSHAHRWDSAGAEGLVRELCQHYTAGVLAEAVVATVGPEALESPPGHQRWRCVWSALCDIRASASKPSVEALEQTLRGYANTAWLRIQMQDRQAHAAKVATAKQLHAEKAPPAPPESPRVAQPVPRRLVQGEAEHLRAAAERAGLSVTRLAWSHLDNTVGVREFGPAAADRVVADFMAYMAREPQYAQDSMRSWAFVRWVERSLNPPEGVT